METFTTFLAGFFKGKQSMTRLCLLIATLSIFGTWSYTSIDKKELQPISKDLIMAYGLIVAGKTSQAYVEKKYNEKLNSTEIAK